MARKSHFKKAVGSYFFNVKMGYNNTIIISRKTRSDAEYAFDNYVKQKKQIEWLGQWDGKKYQDSVYKSTAA